MSKKSNHLFTIILVDRNGNERIHRISESNFYNAFLVAKLYINHAKYTERIHLLVKSITDNGLFD